MFFEDLDDMEYVLRRLAGRPLRKESYRNKTFELNARKYEDGAQSRRLTLKEREEKYPRFSETCAKVRELTINQRYRDFAYGYLGKEAFHNRDILPEKADWFLLNFSQQLEREEVPSEVSPELGWSVQTARKFFPERKNAPSFYFSSGYPDTYWRENVNHHSSIIGSSDCVTKLHLSSDLIDFKYQNKSMAIVIKDIEYMTRDLLLLALNIQLPRDIKRFFNQILEYGHSLFTEHGALEGVTYFRSCKSVQLEVDLSTGHRICITPNIGGYWKDPSIGNITVSISPR